MPFIKNKSGQAVVEFALVVPLFLFLFFLIVYFGKIYSEYMVVENATRLVSRELMVGKSTSLLDTSNPTSAICQNTSAVSCSQIQTTVSKLDASGSSWSALSKNPGTTMISGDTIKVTVTFNAGSFPEIGISGLTLKSEYTIIVE